LQRFQVFSRFAGFLDGELGTNGLARPFRLFPEHADRVAAELVPEQFREGDAHVTGLLEILHDAGVAMRLSGCETVEAKGVTELVRFPAAPEAIRQLRLHLARVGISQQRELPRKLLVDRHSLPRLGDREGLAAVFFFERYGTDFSQS
jgi:hypothetical protein